jgi:protein-tyrosine phosphatase
MRAAAIASRRGTVRAMALVDLHCHLLPGIDDGALDDADAVAMARQAVADGIGTVCATPHVRHDHDVRIGELSDRVAALRVLLAGAGLDVDVVTGAEVAESSLRDLDDDELRAASLGGGGRWILLEPAPGPLGDALVDGVQWLRRRELQAVIAHPERHIGPAFHDVLEALVARGALIQVTAALLLREPTAVGLRDLARRGLVHLLGSDAHSSHGGRPVALAAALARLEEIELLAPHARWIGADGPAAILRGEAVVAPFGVHTAA